MEMTFAATYPDRINGAIDDSTVSIFGPDIDNRYQSASFHFRNYHVYLNTEFGLSESDGLFNGLPRHMLAKHPFTNDNGILKGHRVHIFLTRLNPAHQMASLGRFVINSYLRSDHVVTIHIPRNGTELLDVICPAINTSFDVQKIHYAGEAEYKKLDYKRYNRIVNIIVEREPTSTVFKVNDQPIDSDNPPKYLIIGWGNYGRIAYMLKDVKKIDEPFQLHKV